MLQRHILGNDLYDIILQPHLIHDLPRISHGIIPPSITVEKEVLFTPLYILNSTHLRKILLLVYIL